MQCLPLLVMHLKLNRFPQRGRVADGCIRQPEIDIWLAHRPANHSRRTLLVAAKICCVADVEFTIGVSPSRMGEVLPRKQRAEYTDQPQFSFHLDSFGPD